MRTIRIIREDGKESDLPAVMAEALIKQGKAKPAKVTMNPEPVTQVSKPK